MFTSVKQFYSASRVKQIKLLIQSNAPTCREWRELVELIFLAFTW